MRISNTTLEIVKLLLEKMVFTDEQKIKITNIIKENKKFNLKKFEDLKILISSKIEGKDLPTYNFRVYRDGKQIRSSKHILKKSKRHSSKHISKKSKKRSSKHILKKSKRHSSKHISKKSKKRSSKHILKKSKRRSSKN